MTYVFKHKSYPPLNLLLYISGCSAAGSALDWGSRGRKFKSCQFFSISTAENSKSKNSSYKNIFKKTNNNNPKQGGSDTKPS